MSWFKSSATDVIYPELKTPTTPEELKAIADEAVKEILETFNTDDGWSSIPYNAEGGEGIQLFENVVKGKSICPVKAKGVVKASKEAILSLLIEKDIKKLRDTGLDSDITTFELLETHGDVSVRYSAFTVGPMISDREFVFIQVSRDLPDGSTVLSFKSINRADKKQAASHVRGVIFLAGALIVPQDNGECMVHRTLEIDPKGSIPGWVVNLNKTKVADKITKIRKLTAAQ